MDKSKIFTDLGELVVVNNKRRRFGANRQYYVTWVKVAGAAIPIALTHNQLTRAKKRAAKNPEDIPPLNEK